MDRDADKERYAASMAQLNEILKDISETAKNVSTWRCPYKNVQDRCTANFGCRNQSRRGAHSDRPMCTGSDDLDYRNAWES